MLAVRSFLVHWTKSQKLSSKYTTSCFLGRTNHIWFGVKVTFRFPHVAEGILRACAAWGGGRGLEGGSEFPSFSVFFQRCARLTLVPLKGICLPPVYPAENVRGKESSFHRAQQAILRLRAQFSEPEFLNF
jgi:hypothetical protein